MKLTRVNETLFCMEDETKPPKQSKHYFTIGGKQAADFLMECFNKNAAAPVQAQEPVAVPDGWKPIAPESCPITGRKFWGNIDHPERGLVATYGGPFDTYSIPYLSDDNELRVERFDQDAGDWVEGGEPCGWYSDEQPDAAQAAQGDAIKLLEEVMRPYGIYDVAVSKGGVLQMDFIEIGNRIRTAIAAKAAS